MIEQILPIRELSYSMSHCMSLRHVYNVCLYNDHHVAVVVIIVVVAVVDIFRAVYFQLIHTSSEALRRKNAD